MLKLVLFNVFLTLVLIFLWILESQTLPVLLSQSTSSTCIDGVCGNYSILTFSDDNTMGSVLNFRTTSSNETLILSNYVKSYKLSQWESFAKPMLNGYYYGDCAAPFYPKPRCNSDFYSRCSSSDENICYSYSKLYPDTCLFGFDGVACFNLNISINHTDALLNLYQLTEVSDEDDYLSLEVNGKFIRSDYNIPTRIKNGIYISISTGSLFNYDMESSVIYTYSTFTHPGPAKFFRRMIPKTFMCQYNPIWGCLGVFQMDPVSEKFVFHNDPSLYYKISVQSIWNDKYLIETNDELIQQLQSAAYPIFENFRCQRDPDFCTYIEIFDEPISNVIYTVYSLNTITNVYDHLNNPIRASGICLQYNREFKSDCNFTISSDSYGILLLVNKNSFDTIVCNQSCVINVLYTQITGKLKVCNLYNSSCIDLNITYITVNESFPDTPSGTVIPVNNWNRFIKYISNNLILRTFLKIICIILTIVVSLMWMIIALYYVSQHKGKYRESKLVNKSREYYDTVKSKFTGSRVDQNYNSESLNLDTTMNNTSSYGTVPNTIIGTNNTNDLSQFGNESYDNIYPNIPNNNLNYTGTIPRNPDFMS